MPTSLSLALRGRKPTNPSKLTYLKLSDYLRLASQIGNIQVDMQNKYEYLTTAMSEATVAPESVTR